MAKDGTDGGSRLTRRGLLAGTGAALTTAVVGPLVPSLPNAPDLLVPKINKSLAETAWNIANQITSEVCRGIEKKPGTSPSIEYWANSFPRLVWRMKHLAQAVTDLRKLSKSNLELATALISPEVLSLENKMWDGNTRNALFVNRDAANSLDQALTLYRREYGGTNESAIQTLLKKLESLSHNIPPLENNTSYPDLFEDVLSYLGEYKVTPETIRDILQVAGEVLPKEAREVFGRLSDTTHFKATRQDSEVTDTTRDKITSDQDLLGEIGNSIKVHRLAHHHYEFIASEKDTLTKLKSQLENNKKAAPNARFLAPEKSEDGESYIMKAYHLSYADLLHFKRTQKEVTAPTR